MIKISARISGAPKSPVVPAVWDVAKHEMVLKFISVDGRMTNCGIVTVKVTDTKLLY
jgi:hypothetical protein